MYAGFRGPAGDDAAEGEEPPFFELGASARDASDVVRAACTPPLRPSPIGAEAAAFFAAAAFLPFFVLFLPLLRKPPFRVDF